LAPELQIMPRQIALPADVAKAVGRDMGGLPRGLDGVADEGAGLEQVGIAGVAARDTEIRAAAGQREPGDGIGAG
jgi:hypothetical protein